MRPHLLLFLFATLLGCGQTPDPYASSSSPDADSLAVLTGDDADPLDGGEPESGDPPGDDGSSPVVDAGSTGPSLDATAPPPAEGGPTGACDRPIGPGDLVIDELMIESVAGSGDYGEWLEIENTADCSVNIAGLHGDCPVGAKVYTFDVTEDLWIPSMGTFVVADSVDPAVDHDLPGILLAWSGQPGDVLRNEGGTVNLRFGDTLVDSLTWPSMKLAVGTSLELPADCSLADAADFSLWQPATSSWFPGFRGTPNAPNIDVQCSP
jgi:hypothetical protein